MDVRHVGLLATLVRSEWLVFRLRALVVAKEPGWCSSALMPFSRVHRLLSPKQRCDLTSPAVVLRRACTRLLQSTCQLCLEGCLAPSSQLLTKQESADCLHIGTKESVSADLGGVAAGWDERGALQLLPRLA